MSLKNIHGGCPAVHARPAPSQGGDLMKRSGPWVKVIIAAMVGLALAACSNDSLSDLRSFVKAEKAKPGGRVEPIPEVKPFESFAYKVNGRKSPFQPWGMSADSGKASGLSKGGLHPDTHRRREALEAFPLDSLHMVGTLSRKNGMWAIIKAPDGMVYRVKRNNYMGQNYGRITKISEDKVELVEIVPNGLGGWQERRAHLVLAEKSH